MRVMTPDQSQSSQAELAASGRLVGASALIVTLPSLGSSDDVAALPW